eukprot:11497004-Alexandrium_andersonii.AAC.2
MPGPGLAPLQSAPKTRRNRCEPPSPQNLLTRTAGKGEDSYAAKNWAFLQKFDMVKSGDVSSQNMYESAKALNHRLDSFGLTKEFKQFMGDVVSFTEANQAANESIIYNLHQLFVSLDKVKKNLDPRMLRAFALEGAKFMVPVGKGAKCEAVTTSGRDVPNCFIRSQLEGIEILETNMGDSQVYKKKARAASKASARPKRSGRSGNGSAPPAAAPDEGELELMVGDREKTWIEDCASAIASVYDGIKAEIPERVKDKVMMMVISIALEFAFTGTVTLRGTPYASWK